MIPLFKVQYNSVDLNAILASGQITAGKNARAFEEALSKYIGNIRTLTFSSYNMAALIAWDLLQIKPGDEVIASPMSCLASNQPLAIKGAKLVWADIDPMVGSLDPTSVRSKITARTKAILHYHWCGYPGYIDEILEIGKEKGIPVIEDAIESFGSKYKGNLMGNTGADMTLFSFQPVRLPNSLDGGAISFNNQEWYDKAVLLRDYGINRQTFRDEMGEISSHCDISVAGYGASLNELNSSIGLNNLKQTPELIEKQLIQAQKWDKLFNENKEATPIKTIGANAKPNYWVYSVLSEERDEMLKKYREKGWYGSKVHLRNDRYTLFSKQADLSLKGVNEFEKKQLSLPCGWWV